MNELRIVLLGKSGDGKSSSGNTILGEDTFPTANTPNSVTRTCESRTKTINGRVLTVVDAPGFYDTNLPEEEVNSEILRCITECAPGPHAFVIVLREGRYSEPEKKTVRNITASFGEEALRHAVILFTHGDQLSENQTIEDFVNESPELQELVDKCGGRVHVIDNKYWKEQQEGYRSNRAQVEKLLSTIEGMVRESGGRYYSNEMLQMVNRAIETELVSIRSEGSEEGEGARDEAKQSVFKRLLRGLVGVGTGILVGLFYGAIAGGTCVISITTHLLGLNAVTQASFQLTAESVAPTLAKTAGLSVTATTAIAFVVGTAIVGGIGGAIAGYEASKRAKTLTEAMKLAAKATHESAEKIKESCWCVGGGLGTGPNNCLK